MDYNYRTHTAHELRDGCIYLDTHYAVDIQQKIKDLLKKGVDAGLEQCEIFFESTYEPHEDYLGKPLMGVRGVRPLNEEELEQQRYADLIKDLADELGVSYYDASQIYTLSQRGLVNIRKA